MEAREELPPRFQRPSFEQPERREVTITGMAWNTPVPPAEFFEGFNEVAPDGAARLFKMFEEEPRHRRLIERRAQLFPFIVQIFGRVCALLFALALLGLAAYAISKEAYWVAGIIGSGALGIVVTAFINMPSYPSSSNEDSG